MKKDTRIVISDSNYIDQLTHFFSSFPYESDFRNHSDCVQAINVKYIHECIRLLVKRRLFPEICKNKMSEKIRFLMDSYVRNRWLSKMEGSENPSLLDKECSFIDYSIGVYCAIDAIIRINTEKFAFNFRYLNNKEFDSVVKNGPFKKDVVSMVASLFLSDLHKGVIVYEHETMKSFIIQRNELIYNAVLRKCKKVNEFIFKKEMPDKCVTFQTKKCFLDCK